ncbi:MULTISPECIES: SGNH/GDSL hydrolase family protein [Cyanophyceae]|uniref:SGNH/GDSL hydrolase family protein n=1 Tax=Cyanophyceae TaxID=3028117 RepID=UPI001689B6DA|nr:MULTISPECIES: SGNH/GDSL hydrolase family protein [Cyanophyceae]MBD1918858.1 SGNH/GDSL hydrolase family protein [Phormidium sp. FACHB-77]MBD2033299.1 SGNH/GDSL hydrolase family protein [Phormidium sp. FACHB-322]MBD2053768.1 SGNH/GDSL hydrolase family protein [Leptolyngbya sp. FACHB-60]
MPQFSTDAAVAGVRAELDGRDTANRDRANHEGIQLAETIADFDAVAAAAAPVQTVAGKAGNVTLAKADVGLANVDNTFDSAKPVSGPQQIALNAKANLSAIATVGLTGAYGDLAGRPNLSPAALGAATAAQGLLAETAVQPAALATALDAKAGLQSTVATRAAATVNLDMAALTGSYQSISLTGNLTLTTSNRAAGRSVWVQLLAGGATRGLTLPSGWQFLRAARPTNIAAGRSALLEIKFFGTADTDALCVYSVTVDNELHPDVIAYQSAYNPSASTPLSSAQAGILNTAFSTQWMPGISWDTYKSKIAGLWLAPASAGDVGPIAVPFRGFAGMANVGFLAANVLATGVQGGNSRFLNLNFNPSTGITDPNQAGFGWFNSAAIAASSGIEFGGFRNGTDAIFSGYSNTVGNSSFAAFSLANRRDLPSMTNLGAKYCVRSAANLMQVYNKRTVVGSTTAAPGTPPNVIMLGFARNNNNTGTATQVNVNSAFTGPLLSLFVSNGALTQNEWLSFEALLNFLFVSRGGVITAEIGIDGDSISVNSGQGVPAEDRYPFKVAAVRADNYTTYAVGGQTLIQMNSNILTHLAEKPFDCLILWGGTNDMYFGATGQETYNRAITLVQNVRAAYPALPIVFVNTLPRSGLDTPANFLTQQQAYNAALAADTINFPRLANVAAIPEMQDTTSLTYYLDGTHPTALGHTLLANTILPVVNAALGR